MALGFEQLLFNFLAARNVSGDSLKLNDFVILDDKLDGLANPDFAVIFRHRRKLEVSSQHLFLDLLPIKLDCGFAVISSD